MYLAQDKDQLATRQMWRQSRWAFPTSPCCCTLPIPPSL